MKITINEDSNVVRILLRDTPIEQSDERGDGVILDYDRDGKLVGFEFLNATEFFGDLKSLWLTLNVEFFGALSLWGGGQ